MKLDKKEFVQRLDRTAEKNPLLWLPCVVLLTVILVVSRLGERLRASVRSTGIALSGGHSEAAIYKPLGLRVLAMTLVVAFSFMLVPEFGEVISVGVFAEEGVESDYIADGSEKSEINSEDSQGYDEDSQADDESEDNNENSQEDGEESQNSYNGMPDSIDESSDYGIMALDDEVNSGQCGDNVFWEIDSNGTLTISGTGNMDNYFYDYSLNSKLSPWDSQKSKIKQIIIMNDVTSIGDYAFYSCYNLKNIIIPDSVTSIGKAAFYNCGNLRNITIPDSVTLISDYVFYNCSGLTTIIIPDSITSIGCYAFSLCVNLTTITIPDSVTSIGDHAFSSCTELINIIIPNGVTSISQCAFGDCRRLTNITISDSATSIDRDAFMGCSSLTNIIIPDSVTSIGDYAFFFCSNLTNIIIPDSVTSIAISAFYSCGDLTIYGYTGSYAETYANENDIPFKDINQFNEPDIESSGLTAKYGDDTIADINKINMYENIYFYIDIPENTDNTPTYSGNIYLRRYSDEPSDPPYKILDTPDLWIIENGEIYIVIEETNNYLESSTKYYFDLSDVLINGENCFAGVNFKEKYNFTTGFGVIFGVETFNFANRDSDFWTDKKEYILTDEFYNNVVKENYGIFKRNKIKNKMESEWSGSCEGISAIMMLQNNGYIDEKFPYGVAEDKRKDGVSAGDYPVPSSQCGKIPYGSRDLINYMHIVANVFQNTRHKKADDIETIKYILERADNIESMNDIFKLGYSNSQGKSGHAVVVVGGDAEKNILYLYDSSSHEYNCEKVEVKIQDGKVIINSINGNEYDNKEIHNIDYVTVSGYASYLTGKLRNKTRISNLLNEGILAIQDINNKFLSIASDTEYNGTLIPDDIYYTANGDTYSEMAIILPPDNYYEINTDNGELDYNIVNEDMFFAAKADKAEKSVVSAGGGIQLINAVGNYELTVSTADMPYDMFDISGTANGDVVCEYTDNGVEVNLDNTSDTVITIYHDLETTDYVVPEEYDSFLIGEENDEEAIFVDTDGDGEYDTDIINELKPYSVSIPSNVTVYRNNKVLTNDSKLGTGDVLTIIASVPDGYKLESLKVNGVSISNGGTYTVGSEDIVITVEYSKISGDHTHTPASEWSYNEQNHWKICTDCGEILDYAAHNEDKVTVTIEPTETETGLRTYYCTVCGYAVRSEIIPATGWDDPTPPGGLVSYGGSAPAPAGSVDIKTFSVRMENIITGQTKKIRTVRTGKDYTADVGLENKGYYANIYNMDNEFLINAYIKNAKAVFTLEENVDFYIVIDAYPHGNDVSAAAGAYGGSVPIETAAAPVSDGVTVPAVRLPQIMKFSNKKRRYKILRRRRLDDMVFVY